MQRGITACQLSKTAQLGSSIVAMEALARQVRIITDLRRQLLITI